MLRHLQQHWATRHWNEQRKANRSSVQQTVEQTEPHLRQEEVLELLLLVRQGDDSPVSVHHPDLLNADVELQLNRPEDAQKTSDFTWTQSINQQKWRTCRSARSPERWWAPSRWTRTRRWCWTSEPGSGGLLCDWPSCRWCVPSWWEKKNQTYLK